jgi:hypothetical protein
MTISWRDRLLLLNAVLFCILGVALLLRYARREIGWTGALLGGAVLAHGGYRLYLAGKELRRRAAGSGGG